MIRELAKSTLSVSWALSLLGMKQVINLGGSGQQDQGRDLFAPVAQVLAGQLDDSLKEVFRTGDNLQSRMVDLAFYWMNPFNLLNSRSSQGDGAAGGLNLNDWIRSATNFTEAATGCCRHDPASSQGQDSGPAAASSCSNANGDVPACNESASTGWGPMPGDAS
jgi:hypothetical protein